MPQIHLRMLPPEDNVDLVKTMKEICSGVAKIVGVPSHIIRASWDFVTPGQYVHGDVCANRQQFETHPPTVTIAMLDRGPEVISATLEYLAEELSKSLHIEKGNALITYVEIKKGQVHYVVKAKK